MLLKLLLTFKDIRQIWFTEPQMFFMVNYVWLTHHCLLHALAHFLACNFQMTYASWFLVSMLKLAADNEHVQCHQNSFNNTWMQILPCRSSSISLLIYTSNVLMTGSQYSKKTDIDRNISPGVSKPSAGIKSMTVFDMIW